MAELKFYLCQTDDGPRYVHLQAEAKKLDRDFKTVMIDTSKQALMDRLNGLIEKAESGTSRADAKRADFAKSDSDDRYRIYVGGMFACAMMAPDTETARERAIACLEVRPDTSR